MTTVYTKDSDKYYITEYVKCPLCGKLVYEDIFSGKKKEDRLFFCSEWCKHEYYRRKSNSAAQI